MAKPKPETKPQPTTAKPKPTADAAIANAARLFEFAEMETDMAKMERFEKLGDSWMSLAGLLTQRERDA